MKNSNLNQQATASYDFTGKVVLVTGSASGIGKSTAAKFHGFGAQVVITDINKEEGSKTAAALGERAVFLPCDIRNPKQVGDLIDKTVELFGRLDIMVNNAGINTTAKADRVTIDQYPSDTWQKMIDVDLNGTFYCCKAAAKVMIGQNGGVIVNIASVAGVVALRLQSGFVAAKAAVLKMTEAMACELAPYGIRVNAVSPGSILTDTTRNLFYSETGSFSAMAERLVSFIPQGRPGVAEEIADAIVFLSSGSASYINGHNLVVDGGWTCGFNRDF
ncbi:SDR family NAD(P)-dependent oxidoreductase [Flavihumibacter fluvii]|uniref:SDR family NAD(P)-dependent oxidoreductase n=1 Tax=Flavihumibacter fluvii TaxID=2838157 RepID=UPI001BDE3B5B|nr:SDR family NAD(P)-dependent oxidoreductase [Flavihumibacter fluvii]ULQ51971.1 SDR family oxidoreductase [Flavihumibacter fluvii]